MSAVSMFDRINYQIWAVKIKVHLNEYDLWDAIERDYEVPDLTINPTMYQIKIHGKKKKKGQSHGLLVCCRFSQYIHKNHEPALSKSHKWLSQRTIPRWWTSEEYVSIKLD